MPSDVESLLHWTRIMLLATAICVTLFPLLYGLIAPWYNSHLGRAVLLQSVSVALIIDITAYAQFWPFTADFKKLLIINVVCFSFISLASLYLTTTLLVINLRKRFTGRTHEVEQHDV
jgi:hypothetical protein